MLPTGRQSTRHLGQNWNHCFVPALFLAACCSLLTCRDGSVMLQCFENEPTGAFGSQFVGARLDRGLLGRVGYRSLPQRDPTRWDVLTPFLSTKESTDFPLKVKRMTLIVSISDGNPKKVQSTYNVGERQLLYGLHCALCLRLEGTGFGSDTVRAALLNQEL